MAQFNVGYTTDEYAAVSEPLLPHSQAYESPDPLEYNDIIKMPMETHSNYIPPPQYEGPGMPNQVIVISAPIPQNPQIDELKFKKLYLKLGKVLIVFGTIQVILDPLLPILFQYPHSVFLGGLFTVFSGFNSVRGSRNDNKCLLRASLTMNIFALINISSSIIAAVFFIRSGHSSVSCKNIIFKCFNSPEFYRLGHKGLSIFNIVYGFLMFVLLWVDSVIKCRDICCCKRQQRRVVTNTDASMLENIN